MTDRIDTSAVEVPASLIPLRERLAALRPDRVDVGATA